MLRLRALRSSGDFDDYWRFHEAQEWERTHRQRYADGQLPALQQPNNEPHLSSGTSVSQLGPQSSTLAHYPKTQHRQSCLRRRKSFRRARISPLDRCAQHPSD